MADRETQDTRAGGTGRWPWRIAYVVVMAAILLGMCEATGSYMMGRSSQYDTLRGLLRGVSGHHLKNRMSATPQPYLLYISTPGFKSHGIVQHNKQGYRGAPLPVERTPRALRILFLGGSTTYSSHVPAPSQSYPAATRRVLSHPLPADYRSVEIINAGLRFGTSAELLTHFLFKFRYYRPDLVVLNTGGNDAAGVSTGRYHPDYSHWRQQLPTLRPLGPHARWLMGSDFAAYLTIKLFYDDVAEGSYFVRRAWNPPVPWYDRATRGEDGTLVVPDGDLAFENNVRTIVREAQADGSLVLLVPFRPSPRNKYKPVVRAEMERNERVLEDIAQTEKSGFTRFSADTISPNNWKDDCHLNAAGSKEKAIHVAEAIRKLIAERGVPKLRYP